VVPVHLAEPAAVPWQASPQTPLPHSCCLPACLTALASPAPPRPAVPAVFTGAFWVILRVLFSFMWLSLLLGPLAM
jgi:hypothetical protein